MVEGGRDVVWSEISLRAHLQPLGAIQFWLAVPASRSVLEGRKEDFDFGKFSETDSNVLPSDPK